MKKQAKNAKFKAASIIVLVFAAGMLAGVYFSPPVLKEAVFKTRNLSAILPNAGYSTANISMEGNRVVLLANCRELSFEITEDQAFSIRLGLEKNVFSRPLTHDLLKDVLDHYDFRLESAAIDRFEEEIYKARITVSKANEVLDLDARPSDTIALAARYGTGIKVKDSIMNSKGEKVC